MGRLLWGALLTIVGTFLLLQGIGTIPGNALSFWPVLFMVVGLSIVWRGLFPGRFSPSKRPSWFKVSLGLWIGGIGLFDILSSSGLLTLDGRTFFRQGWPILLVGAGLSLLFTRPPRSKGTSFELHDSEKAYKRWGRSAWYWGWGGPHTRLVGDTHYGRTPWELDGPLHVRHRVGDIRIDLTTATIPDGQHEVSVISSVGEIVIIVPDSCNASVEASVSVGDLRVFDDERSGISNYLTKEVNVPDATVSLKIEAHLRIGTVSIRRAPSTTHGKARAQ